MHDLEDRLRAALTKHADDVDASDGQGQVRPQEGGPRMRRAVALLVALGFTGGVLAAGLWVAGRGGQEPAPAEDPEREVISEDPGALVCEEAPRNPQIAANEAWPRTFAGYWIDESEGILHVAFTEGAEAKTARLAECFPERTFAPVTFEHSLAELEGVLDRMRRDRELIRAGQLTLRGVRDERYSFGLLVKENVIHVIIEEVTPETIATFEGRYGDVVTVEEGYPGGPGGPEPAVNTEAVSCEDARWGVDAIAKGVWPDSYAGFWERRETTFLAFTEGAEEKVAELAECFPDDTLVPVTVELSGQELEAIVARMAADRELIGSGQLTVQGIPNDRYDMAPYVKRNAVLVWLEELDPETIAAFERRYGEALIFRQLKVRGP